MGGEVEFTSGVGEVIGLTEGKKEEKLE